MPGPPPKRTSQRRRRNKPAGGDVETADGARVVKCPRPDPSWHKVAKRWYNSLKLSGQAVYYEPSDWAVAFVIAESMSRDLQEQFVGFTDEGEVIKEVLPLKGASLTAYLRAMSALMVTEGDRRRVRLELERRKPAEDGEGNVVTWLSDARQRVGGAG